LAQACQFVGQLLDNLDAKMWRELIRHA
jgi:hypothetical protein